MMPPEIETGKLLPNSNHGQMFIHQAEKLADDTWFVGYTADMKGKSRIRRFAILRWTHPPYRHDWGWTALFFMRNGSRWGQRRLFVESTYNYADVNGPRIEIHFEENDFEQGIFWMKHLYQGVTQWPLQHSS